MYAYIEMSATVSTFPTAKNKTTSLRNWLLNNMLNTQSSFNSSFEKHPNKTRNILSLYDDPKMISNNSSYLIQMREKQVSKKQAEFQECILCKSGYTLDQFTTLQNCMHQFCMDCINTYTKFEVQKGYFNLKCPQCEKRIHPNDIALILGAKHRHPLRLYDSLIWCPRPDCTFAIKVKSCSNPKPQKKLDFLAKDCQKVKEQIKACQNCQVLTVKMQDTSCNQVTCTVCGIEF